jgi:hypothetical protein
MKLQTKKKLSHQQISLFAMHLCFRLHADSGELAPKPNAHYSGCHLESIVTLCIGKQERLKLFTFETTCSAVDEDNTLAHRFELGKSGYSSRFGV